MPISFDPRKSRRNAEARGMPFEVAEGFDFTRAIVRRDDRPHPGTGLPYPEDRFQAIGRLGTRVVMLVFTPTADGFRVISLRLANRREREAWRARYSTITTPPD